MKSGGFYLCFLVDWIFSTSSLKFTFLFFNPNSAFFDLCGSGGLLPIPPLSFTPCFKLFKLFCLCRIHVIKLTSFTTSWVCWLTFVALPLRVFKAFYCKVNILTAVGATCRQFFINSRVGISMMVLLLVLRLFILLFPALAAPELLSFDLLSSEILFVLLGFLYSFRMNAILSSV